MHGCSSGSAILVNAEVDSMGGVVDGVGIGSEPSPRRAAIEKAQAELREEYDVHEAKEKQRNCLIFLLFSVNASAQFCGVAEMVGPVDYDKSVDYWKQDKWTGQFPVKWHTIKDVPNSQFRHIILENNDNKPVTNSRDTQDVELEQGNEMLNIFRNYESNSSILDDFDFYEDRQKAMQEKIPIPNSSV